MANLKNRTGVTTDRKFEVHAPRNPHDPQEFAKFTASLNRELSLISDKFATMPKLARDFNPDDYVRTDDLPDLIDAHTNDTTTELSSDAQQTAGGTTSDTTTTGNDSGEDAQAAINNANPTGTGPPGDPPPAVDKVSKTGTTVDPLLFALADHTHRGATLSRAHAFGAPRGYETKIRPIAGTYGNGTTVAVITVDQNGRVQAVTTAAITATSTDLAWRRAFLFI